MVEWFEETYLVSQWSLWFVTVDVPGVVPSQNVIELFYLVTKTECIHHLRASTATVLKSAIPGILARIGDQPITEKLHHYCKGMRTGFGLLQEIR